MINPRAVVGSLLSSLLVPRGCAAFSAGLAARRHRAPSSARSSPGLCASTAAAVEPRRDDPPPASEASPSKSPSSAFDDFDYASHWYPVVWSRDVPLNQPIRVTLFDVDYALVKTTLPKQRKCVDASSGEGGKKRSQRRDDGDDAEEEVFYAMVDSCPHKKVALSEGRVTDRGTADKKYLQCSYHGWSFEGETGECVEIPQREIAKSNNKLRGPAAGGGDGDDVDGNMGSGVDSTPRASKKARREDAAPVAVRDAQGMVYLAPHHTPLSALAATETGALRPPPHVPELDLPGYRAFAVGPRDFPIDWTVLLENIMDPDHGYFAHASSGTSRGFDWYVSDGVDNTVHVDEVFGGGGWNATSTVKAVDKLQPHNQQVRMGTKEDTKKKREDDAPPKLATTTFVAPAHVTLARRANATAAAAFVTAFWVSPTGTGRSRFLSAGIGKTPVGVPRWLAHINVNNFLDQDTFLLCGQHRAVLRAEAEGYRAEEERAGEGDDAGGGAPAGVVRVRDARRATYVYRSPSERLPARIGQFFDATLARAPNRKEGVLAWYERNAHDGKLLEPWPTREEVLDRYEQHTKVCQDSMDVVRRCDRVISTSKVTGFLLIFMKMVLRSIATTASATWQNPFGSGVTIFAAVRQLASQSASLAGGLANRMAAYLLQDRVFYPVVALAFLSSTLASRIRREFFFKFDEELHRKDVKLITRNWMDL